MCNQIPEHELEWVAARQRESVDVRLHEIGINEGDTSFVDNLTPAMSNMDLSRTDWPIIAVYSKECMSRRSQGHKCFYVLRAGMRWRNLPARYGRYTTAYNRFNR